MIWCGSYIKKKDKEKEKKKQGVWECWYEICMLTSGTDIMLKPCALFTV